jgi:hypothetical protein
LFITSPLFLKGTAEITGGVQEVAVKAGGEIRVSLPVFQNLTF